MRKYQTIKKKIYKCVHLKKSRNVCDIAGISEKVILDILDRYDCIVPYRTSLEKMSIHSAYEDYMKKIPGVHVSDIYILEGVFKDKHPDLYGKLQEYLFSPNKLMYQIFITKPDLFDLYCEWLFELLFAADPLIDTSLYTTNGRRIRGR